MKSRSLRSRARGLSLVEVLISLVIGLVVVGAVLTSYLASGRTNRFQAAYAEMNENAQIGLGILSRDLLLAGYSQPTGVNGAGTGMSRNYSGRAVFGCNNGFVSPTAVAVACAAAAVAPAVDQPAIEVIYEADITNTVPNGGVPSDCLGASLTSLGTYYLTHNRYYLAAGSTGRSELHCASDKALATGQPLVDNVEAMTILYGEANAVDPRTIVRYVTASNLADNTFANVVSVRVCMLMRSTEPVLTGEDVATYLDCNSVQQTSGDRYLRRAYFTTTTLRNKMAL